MPHFFGINCPRLKLETISYWTNSSLLLWFGLWSIEPKPIVEYLPEAEKLAKSARFPSIDPTVAHPPFESIPEILNSLNQTSPHNWSPKATEGFFNPIIIVFIDPKEGFPFIDNLYFLRPGKELIGVNSFIRFKSSS